jgi:transcriptional coactivator p15 (PC4)
MGRTGSNTRVKRPIQAETFAVVIGERQLGRGDVLRIDIHDFKGNDYLNLRKWYTTADGQPAPGKGLTVSVHLIPWLLGQLQKAEQHALELGLLAEEDFELVGRDIPREILLGPSKRK